MSTAKNHSDVIVFPPVLPIGGFMVGVVLGRLAPLALPDFCRVWGVFVLAAGVTGFAWMVRTMKRARTPIHNAATPTRLVETGPFRLTRNPMYLFGSVVYAGLALVLVQPWALVFLPVVLAITHYGVVLREEAFLARWFGGAYDDYRARVRRWL